SFSKKKYQQFSRFLNDYAVLAGERDREQPEQAGNTQITNILNLDGQQLEQYLKYGRDALPEP
ncbi:MAG: hypothetical protein ACE5D6_05120, partial [Candidatus Zixiibacteriota bacterium]